MPKVASGTPGPTSEAPSVVWVFRLSVATGLSNKKNCLENCDYDKEQCLRP